MAGICRPTQCLNSQEATFKVLSMFSYNGYGTGNDVELCGLFNQTNPDEWDTSNIFYWQTSAHFLEIQINEMCNIWRCGSKSWSDSNKPLDVFYKKNINDEYTNITNDITQNLSLITNTQWELYIKGINPGIYKFKGRDGYSYRMDTEWFLETQSLILLNKNEEYYNINDSNYDIVKKEYVKIVQTNNDLKDLYKNNNVNLKDLFIDKNINNEIFKPIDKLIPFKINKLKVK